MKLKQSKKKQMIFRMVALSLSATLVIPAVFFNVQEHKLNVSANTPFVDIRVVNEYAKVNGATNFIKLSSYEEKLQAAEDEKNKLEDKKKETERKIAELEREKSNILTYIEKLDSELNSITLEIERLQGEINTTNEELEQTKRDLSIAKQTEEDQYNTMKKRIQYMYENGGSTIVETLLSSNNFVDFLNQVEYSKKISEYDNNLFQSYQKTKEEIVTKEAYLTVQLDELSVLEESAAFEQATIEKLVEAKSLEIVKYEESIGINDALVTSYNEEIEDKMLTIEEMKEEERRAKEEAERLRKEEERRRKEEEERRRKEEEERKKQEANNGSSSGSNSDTDSNTSPIITDETSSDKMIWPLPGDGSIHSKFGYRVPPTTGASSYHRGVDIGGAMGASIVAALSGTVEISQYSSTSGNYVIINHGNGLRTAYAHCSKLLVSAGEYVKQGEAVGLVGSTGVSTGPHLHFGVSINSVYVDPLDYISYGN